MIELFLLKLTEVMQSVSLPMERYPENVLRCHKIIRSSDRLSLLKYSLQVSGNLEFLFCSL